MRKRKKSLMFKAGFLVKVKNLQNNGEKLKLCHKIDIWIDDNIELFTYDKNWQHIVKQQTLEKRDANKSIQIKYDELKQKEILKEIVFNYAVKKVEDHRAKLKMKKFEMYKKKTLDKRVDFNIKNTYIER